MLKPLPLINQNTSQQPEPQLLKAMKRRQTNLRNKLNEDEGCPHMKVVNWSCQECSQKVSQFGSVFDTNGGKVKTFMNVLYENDFLDDFMQSNLNQVQTTEGQTYSRQDTDENKNNKIMKSDFEGMNSQQNHKNSQQSLSYNTGFNLKEPEILYIQYQPQNSTQLREYLNFLLCKTIKRLNKDQTRHYLGSGSIKNLSKRFMKFLTEKDQNEKRLIQKYNGEVLLFDSTFESGNLLQAEMINQYEYQLYMQVDTNTRGHQQWFYFKVKNARPNRKYLFKIMNFTKPGLVRQGTTNQNKIDGQDSEPISHQSTSVNKKESIQAPIQNPGSGFVGPAFLGQKKQEHLQRIHYQTKGDFKWNQIDSEKLEFIKTEVPRRRKDILAAAQDSDQEEVNEDAPDEVGKQAKKTRKRKAQYYYALQFEFQFQEPNKTVYFAFSVPRTLSQITNTFLEKEGYLSSLRLEEPYLDEDDLNQIAKKNKTQKNNFGSQSVQIELPSKGIFYKREELTKSICGIPLQQIIISKDKKNYKKRPLIVITSRVHAAETPASHVYDGIYDFLTSGTYQARALRKLYTFILIPTLNPDGVVCGNYRSSVSGVDLNRQWISPDQDIHPEIFAVKDLMKVMNETEKRRIWIYCDLHGHSKKKNCFFYGCNTAANGGFLSWTIVRLLPRIFARKTHFFNFKDCRFKVEPYKLGTGRVVAWKQFMVTHSFTLESSFYGYDYGEESHKCFAEKDYRDVGAKLCQSIYELHFLWKSIRNELRLTNGWLKPRKLIEITGVPAAQLLNEELMKKKKEELKRKAIEQYEQFLKKFYNNNVALNLASQSIDKKRISQKAQSGTDSSKQNKSSTYYSNKFINTRHAFNPGVHHNAIQSSDKSRNHLLNSKSSSFQKQSQSNTSINHDDVEKEDYESLYKKLLGLVKIQALIRGYLARKNLIATNIRVYQRPSFKARVGLGQSIVTSPRSLALNNFGRQIKPGNKSIEDDIDNINWREYFQEQELEEAFENVEVKKIDDPNDNFSDGSSSNPSIDNLDIQDMTEKVYNFKKAKNYEQNMKKAKDQFSLDLLNQDLLDQQRMMQLIDEALSPKKSFIESQQKTLKQQYLKQNSSVRKTLKVSKNLTEIKNPNQSNLLSQLQANQVSSPDRNLNHQDSNKKIQNVREKFQAGLAQRKSPYHPQFYSTGINIDQQVLKKSNTQSPIANDQASVYPLTTHSIFENKTLSKVQQQNTRQLQGQTQYPQSLTHISTQQLKVFQQQQMSYVGKRENISQVIKDCFITKKISNKLPHGIQNSHELSRNQGHQQGKKINSTVEGMRMHSIHSNLESDISRNLASQSVYNNSFQPQHHNSMMKGGNQVYNPQQIKFVQNQAKRIKSQAITQSQLTAQNIQSFNSHHATRGQAIQKSPVLQNQKDQNEVTRDQASQFYMQNHNQPSRQAVYNNPTQGIQGQSVSDNKRTNSLFQENQSEQSRLLQFLKYQQTGDPLQIDSENNYRNRSLYAQNDNIQYEENQSEIIRRYVHEQISSKHFSEKIQGNSDEFQDDESIIENRYNQLIASTNHMSNSKSQSLSQNMSRNKHFTRSESKQRSKNLTDSSYNSKYLQQTLGSGQINKATNLNHLNNQFYTQVPVKKGNFIEDQDRLLSYQSVSQSYSLKNHDQTNYTSTQNHNHPNQIQNQDILQQIIIQRQHVENDAIPNMVLNPLNQQVRLPNINSLSQNFNSNKKARDIIKESKSFQNQLHNKHLATQNERAKNSIVNHIPGMMSHQEVQDHNVKNDILAQIQSTPEGQAIIKQILEKQNQRQAISNLKEGQLVVDPRSDKAKEVQAGYHQHRMPQIAHQSHESQFDEEILHKIKSLYSEMKNNSKIQIHNYQQLSKNNRIGNLRQQRLFMPQFNPALGSIDMDESHIASHLNEHGKVLTKKAGTAHSPAAFSRQSEIQSSHQQSTNSRQFEIGVSSNSNISHLQQNLSNFSSQVNSRVIPTKIVSPEKLQRYQLDSREEKPNENQRDPLASQKLSTIQSKERVSKIEPDLGHSNIKHNLYKRNQSPFTTETKL